TTFHGRVSLPTNLEPLFRRGKCRRDSESSAMMLAVQPCEANASGSAEALSRRLASTDSRHAVRHSQQHGSSSLGLSGGNRLLGLPRLRTGPHSLAARLLGGRFLLGRVFALRDEVFQGLLLANEFLKGH